MNHAPHDRHDDPSEPTAEIRPLMLPYAQYESFGRLSADETAELKQLRAKRHRQLAAAVRSYAASRREDTTRRLRAELARLRAELP